ncbi:MAG: uracil-DNA glycosylase [Candidatus Nanoarchaeia archaeon]|nr:uracil-DNA glycosylase [Candidatus Nanoarchaeia archaeon]
MNKLINRKKFLKLPDDWYEIVKEEINRSYFLKLRDFLLSEYLSKHIRPCAGDIFKTFELCSFNNLKVVIIGQDPYHNLNQAHGLAFSVPIGVSLPPSLINIFKEISNDVNIQVPNSGCLVPWSKQGVLLINSFLTVELHKPLSHSKIGWEVFTDFVIQKISKKKENIVFLLWGSFAKSKARLIDFNKHCVLTSCHPSPLSSYKFFGCKHFSKTNEFLKSKNIEPINWSI